MLFFRWLLDTIIGMFVKSTDTQHHLDWLPSMLILLRYCFLALLLLLVLPSLGLIWWLCGYGWYLESWRLLRHTVVTISHGAPHVSCLCMGGKLVHTVVAQMLPFDLHFVYSDFLFFQCWISWLPSPFALYQVWQLFIYICLHGLVSFCCILFSKYSYFLIYCMFGMWTLITIIVIFI